MSDDIERTLSKGLEQLQLDCDRDKLLLYLTLLDKWNKAYNLTAIRHKEVMITKHLLDSLAIIPWLHGQAILDVGTGAGLPGIPLAIARPDLHLVLLDSNGKKTRFLQEVKRQLTLTNVDIVHTRVEDYHPVASFDTITSRAVSDLSQLLINTQHLIANKGIWLAMKGKLPTDELAKLTCPYTIEHYTVPGLNEERCCIIINEKSV